MKKLQVLVLAALVTGSATVAQAQEAQPQAQGGPARVNRGMAMLMSGITLSAEQQVRMDSITSKYETQRQAIVADQSLGEGRRAKVRELMGKQQDEIKAILTPEQKTVFEKNVADMQARMQGGGGQRPPQD